MVRTRMHLRSLLTIRSLPALLIFFALQSEAAEKKWEFPLGEGTEAWYATSDGNGGIAFTTYPHGSLIWLDSKGRVVFRRDPRLSDSGVPERFDFVSVNGEELVFWQQFGDEGGLFSVSRSGRTQKLLNGASGFSLDRGNPFQAPKTDSTGFFVARYDVGFGFLVRFSHD